MKPDSIIWFDRLYIGIVATNLASMLLLLPVIDQRLLNNPQAAAVGIGLEFLFGLAISVMIFSLILWFFVSRFRSNIAKWLVALLLIHSSWTGLVNIASVTDLTLATGALNFLHSVLGILTLYALFTSDSRAWFQH
jgi:hypothetical protein